MWILASQRFVSIYNATAIRYVRVNISIPWPILQNANNADAFQLTWVMWQINFLVAAKLVHSEIFLLFYGFVLKSSHKIQYQKSKDCNKCTGLYLLNKLIEYLLDHWNALRPSQTMRRNYFEGSFLPSFFRQKNTRKSAFVTNKKYFQKLCFFNIFLLVGLNYECPCPWV